MNVLFLSISTIMMMAKRKGYDILFPENYRNAYGRLFSASTEDWRIFFFIFIFLFFFRSLCCVIPYGIPMDKNLYIETFIEVCIV